MSLAGVWTTGGRLKTSLFFLIIAIVSDTAALGDGQQLTKGTIIFFYLVEKHDTLTCGIDGKSYSLNPKESQNTYTHTGIYTHTDIHIFMLFYMSQLKEHDHFNYVYLASVN